MLLSEAMRQVRLPVVTLLLTLITSCLMLLPYEVKAALYFDRNDVLAGNFWTLLSAHMVHIDIEHWGWNTISLLFVGSIIEQRSVLLLAFSFFLSIFAIDLLLLSGIHNVDMYCGISGVLNTFILIALWTIWQKSHSFWVVAAVCLFIVRTISEIILGNSLTTNLAWPAYTEAHMAGVISGGVIIFFYETVFNKFTKGLNGGCKYTG
ncbi:hypothetical protein AltI4_45160 (plasmid) [Alteromonas sp. I4]|nr:hypothetical protein AltI4_45160 [Alteromonas sp. I4]